jgi:putative ABC transport system substrate-binding protein
VTRLAAVACSAVLLALSAGTPGRSEAQQAGKTYRLGFLSATSAARFVDQVDAFRQGLRDFGYVEGKNVTIEFRYADDRYDRLAVLAAELAQLKVDAIVTSGTPATLAIKKATTTIPVVVAIIGDPVPTGVVASYARPGGNITGLSFHFPELMAKRVDVLKEAVPRLTRVAILRNPKNQAAPSALGAIEQMARALKLELNPFDVRDAGEFDAAFAEMTRWRSDGIVVLDDPMLIANGRALALLATKHRLPLIGNQRLAEAGALLGYGTDVIVVFRQSAALVDKVLKGAKPADLPIQQAERVELTVNRKTAKVLELTLPPTLAMRADKVIE